MHPRTTPSPAAWLPFLGPALRLRRHALHVTNPQVNARLRERWGSACHIGRYEGPIVQTVYGMVAYKATSQDIKIQMMVRLASALEWDVTEWIEAAELLRLEHEASMAKAAEAGLDRETFIAGIKAGQWRSPTSPSC